MSQFSFVALNPRGDESRGSIDARDQSEALKRIKDMGLFPVRVSVVAQPKRTVAAKRGPRSTGWRALLDLSIPGTGGRVKTPQLAAFTRNLATLLEAGMPLLRGLRLLHEQETSRALKGIAAKLAEGIESGGTFAEVLAAHPKTFNRLYVNMVKAGELGGALDVTLRRLAEFMEQAEKIKGKVKAAMFYPCAVIFVAIAVVGILLVYVIPKFKEVFAGMNNLAMPPFTELVFGLSQTIQKNFLPLLAVVAGIVAVFRMLLATKPGRRLFDRFKLALPGLGPVLKKVAIGRFARTFGTLVGSGVPILQTLTILRETAGNVVVAGVIGTVHDRVKEGDAIAPVLKSSRVFPAMIAGMVDVGEQTGALPDMLLKIADNCDEEVDNAASAMTSLLEPVLLIFLALVVGSIVVAMFLPLIQLMSGGFDRPEE